MVDDRIVELSGPVKNSRMTENCFPDSPPWPMRVAVSKEQAVALKYWTKFLAIRYLIAFPLYFGDLRHVLTISQQDHLGKVINSEIIPGVVVNSLCVVASLDA